MNEIFVDTWAWYALADERDADHEVARLATDDLIEREVMLVTTNFVLTEATTLIRYNLGHAIAIKFRQTIGQLNEDELLNIVRITESQEVVAGEIFERYDDQDFSFTDCTSFAVMQELKLSEAFTGDKHFTTMGFQLIP